MREYALWLTCPRARRGSFSRRSSADGALAPAQSGEAASRLLSATPPSRSARLSEEETDRWGEEGGVRGRLVKMPDKLKRVAQC